MQGSDLVIPYSAQHSLHNKEPKSDQNVSSAEVDKPCPVLWDTEVTPLLYNTVTLFYKNSTVTRCIWLAVFTAILGTSYPLPAVLIMLLFKDYLLRIYIYQVASPDSKQRRQAPHLNYFQTPHVYNKDLVRIKTVLSALHFPPKNKNSDTDLQKESGTYFCWHLVKFRKALPKFPTKNETNRCSWTYWKLIVS